MAGNWIEISTEVGIEGGSNTITVAARLDRATLTLEHIRISASTARVWLEGNDLELIIAARDELKGIAALVQRRNQAVAVF